jgi:hypothetical protein
MISSIAGEQPQLCRSAGGNPSNRSLRSKGRHSDGNATAPPDVAPVLVVFLSCYAFAMDTRLCGCAGRSYPSHSASQLPQSHGSELHDANETRPCSFTLAQLAYWYEPAVCAKISIKTCAFGRQPRVWTLTRDSSAERPLPADLCGLLSPQAACSLCYTQGMHARSWHLLDRAWKAAAGGICVRYHANRANRARLQFRKGPSCSSSRCSEYPLRMC